MPDNDSYDLAVIGAGSGGMAAAKRAVRAGLSVALFEAGYVGGTCVNLGCVPKKLLVHGSRIADNLADAEHLGWSLGKADFRWVTLRDKVDQEVRRLSALHRENLIDAGVRIIEGQARLTGPRTIESDRGDTIQAAHTIIATGARPARPKLAGIEHTLVSDDLFHLPQLPHRIAIIGGGYIAVEFASLLRRFDVQVTILERGERLIQTFDAEISALLAASLRHHGIKVRIGTRVERIAPSVNGYRIVSNAGPIPGSFDAVLMAAGRVPNVEGLGLKAAGIDLHENGTIKVDLAGRTSTEGIYAVGDVAGRLPLTPVAVIEARCAVDAIVGGAEPAPVPPLVPTAVFTTPECAAVGLTEEAAKEAGRDVDVRRLAFKPLIAAFSEKPEDVVMKALVDRGDDQILGLHFFGPHASEAAQMGAVAMSAGLTATQLGSVVSIHPTIAEELINLAKSEHGVDADRTLQAA